MLIEPLMIQAMRRASSGVFAKRVVHGVDDAGADEEILIWIERQPGALWAVGRCVNPEFPPLSPELENDSSVARLLALADIALTRNTDDDLS